MLTRRSTAVWRGDGMKGQGTLSTQSGAFREQPYSFQARFESEDGRAGTNPEELIGAAHASCFSMALALVLGEHGLSPEAIDTTATVYLDPDRLAIRQIELETEAEVPAVSDSVFQSCAETAKENCPVSKALSGVEILLKSSKLTEVPVERA